jgi:putative toxin-antitoxin system antitoxin component (TIGR02293 family)
MDTQVAELLGGERVLGASVKSNLDLARAIRTGLPAETAVQLAELILDLEPLRGDFGLWEKGPAAALKGSLLLGFVREALNRRRAGNGEEHSPPARLTPEQSDAVVRTAGAMAKAIDVLGDRKKAAHWLTTPNRALGGEIPITLLDTSAGAREVEAVLDRVEYGVYS